MLTARSNFVWAGPTPEISDLHAQLGRGPDGTPITTTIWEPTPDERERLARGENVALRVLGIHPPVLMYVADEPGIGEDDPGRRARLEELKRGER